MLQDIILFLGLLGLVCSIGMRVALRGETRAGKSPAGLSNGRARGATVAARSARRRQ